MRNHICLAFPFRENESKGLKQKQPWLFRLLYLYDDLTHLLGWPAAICVAALLRFWGYHLQAMNAPPILPNLHTNLNSLSHRDCYVRVCPCLCVLRPVCMQGCEMCVYLLPRYGLSSYVGGEDLWKVILPAGWVMWGCRQMLSLFTFIFG